MNPRPAEQNVMNVKPGDLAIVVANQRNGELGNIGKLVRVLEASKVPGVDWIVEGADMLIGVNPSGKVQLYKPGSKLGALDKCLRPLSDPDENEQLKAEHDIPATLDR